jgi:hypothetical protein
MSNMRAGLTNGPYRSGTIQLGCMHADICTKCCGAWGWERP